jgi:hypothetical protein
MRTVVGVFPSREEAEHLAHDLKELGIPEDEVIIADSAGADNHEWSSRNLAACGGMAFGWFIAGLIPVMAERSRVAATLIGASVGSIAGLIGGLAVLVMRGGIPLFGGSPITMALSVLATGALGGGLIAAVYSMGVSHEGKPLVVEAAREHGVVVAAHVDVPREPEILRVMNEHGARNSRAGADAWRASGWTGTHATEEPYPSDSSFISHRPGKLVA